MNLQAKSADSKTASTAVKPFLQIYFEVRLSYELRDPLFKIRRKFPRAIFHFATAVPVEKLSNDFSSCGIASWSSLTTTFLRIFSAILSSFVGVRHGVARFARHRRR